MKNLLKNFLLNKKWEIIIFLIFIVTTLTLRDIHEPWFDEAQAFLLARDNNFVDLLKYLGYEGTPGLWHFILFLFIKIGGLTYAGMHWLHWFLAVTTAGILIFYSPFKIWIKSLLPFGYFFFYEYNFIARSYILTVLFLFIIAAIHNKRAQKPIIYSAILLLLAQTNIHGFVISTILGTFLIYDLCRKKINNNKIIVSAMFLLVSTLAVIIQVFPPVDAAKKLPWLETFSIPQSLLSTNNAFFPISGIKNTFWGSGIILGKFTAMTDYFPEAWVYYAIVLSIFGITFVLLPLVLLKNRRSIALYLCLWSGLNSVFFLLHPGCYRHHGLIWICFLFCWWLDENEKNENYFKISEKIKNILIIFLLTIQIFGTGVAIYFEYKNVFAYGQTVVKYLEKNNWLRPENLVIAFHANSGVTLSPFLPADHPQLYYLEYQKKQTYLVWDKNYGDSLRWNVKNLIENINTAERLHLAKNTILISYMPIFNQNFNQRFRLLQTFTGAVQTESNYFIYLDTTPWQLLKK